MAYKALDIAKYVINYEHSKKREITNLRLQKLLYFVQAKVLVETGSPCFDDDMVAWDFGPVVPAVYYTYKIFGSWDILLNSASPAVSKEISSNMDSILDYCKDYPTFQLVEITHKQTPWITARRMGQNTVITKKSISEYFRQQIRQQNGK